MIPNIFFTQMSIGHVSILVFKNNSIVLTYSNHRLNKLVYPLLQLKYLSHYPRYIHTRIKYIRKHSFCLRYSLNIIFKSLIDDHSRVILANQSVDYINANYIDVSSINHTMMIFNKNEIMHQLFTSIWFFRVFLKRKCTLQYKVNKPVLNLSLVSQYYSF